MAKFETRLFINGKYTDSASGSRLTCYNPVDGSVVTSDVHVAGKDDVDAAVAAARAAFPGWASTPPQQRSGLLLKLADLIDKNANEIARLEMLCTGKPVIQTPFETGLSSAVLRYYAGWCDKIEGESYPTENGFMRIVRREPIGVCAGILAFNGPLVQLSMKCAPCLATGNTAIIKGSEKTPLAVLFLGKLFNEAGFPPGVFQALAGAGETGALLASHMGIDKIAFTGSVNTGRKIAQAATTSNLKKVTLELGGKSPSIVFPDANLDVAVEWCARGITINAGQACIASSVLYVHKDIREKFLNMMKEAFSNMDGVIGNPDSPSTQISTVVDSKQFDRIMKYIEGGKEEATLIAGGERIGDKGCFIKPTIFVDPKSDAKILKEEIFGPVLVIREFFDEDEVIAKANETEFGLSGAVFSQDINRALRVSSKIQAGTVCVNCCTMLDATVAFGGYKSSGWGRELGKAGIDSYSQTKTVFINMMY